MSGPGKSLRKQVEQLISASEAHAAMLSTLQMQVALLQSAHLVAVVLLDKLVLCEACKVANHPILSALTCSLTEHAHGTAHPPIQVPPKAPPC